MNEELIFSIDTVRMALDELVSPDYNPRQDIRDVPDAYKALYNSIDKLKYIDPIVVNISENKNIIISGNQRYKILCDMAEEKKIPLNKAFADVIAVNFNEYEEKAANLALNKISVDWVTDKLKEMIDIIDTNAKDLIESTGFTDAEIDEIINDLPVEKEEKEMSDFRMSLRLPLEYEPVFNMYLGVNGEDALKKEVIKIITGNSNGSKKDNKDK